MKNKFLKGSEWRKWDLHVHTPESSGYSGTWEEFKVQLQNADCSVIGINDYFSIAGYKKIKEEIANSTLNIGEKNILPVVEMRMTDSLQNRNTTTNGNIHFNFHIIFNDKLNIDDIESFLKSLDSGGSIIGSDYADKERLKDKKVSFNDTLKKLQLDKKFRDNYLIWLPYDEYGGIGDIDPNSDGWIKEEFIKKSHILGSSNQNQIDFFLWKSPLKSDGNPKFTKEDFEKWFEHKKPCIKGSDSHSHSDPIGKLKDEKSNPIEKFCWIKSDPTFEGLKQILYEADDRVKIQESRPEERESYQIIESVKFIDKNFTTEEIFLNQNLTVIIGGKSTGKSVLLRNMAEAIDSKEVETRINEAQLQKYPTELEVINFSIKWCDGQESKKVNSQINKKIIYIPQSYLNRLVDKKETETPIFKIVEDALRQDDSVKESFDNLDSQQREIERNISSAVDSLFFIEKDINDLSVAIKNIGDKQGIEIEIKKLEAEIETLKESSGISAEELQKYDDLKNSHAKLSDQKTANKKDLENLVLLKEKEIFNTPNLLSLSQEIQNSLTEEYKSLTQKYLQQWEEKIDAKINAIKANDEELDKSIKTLTEKEKPLSEKVKLSKSLNEKIDLLKKEQGKLKAITEEEKTLKIKKEKFNNVIDQIAENNSKFYDNLFSAKSEILKQKIISGEEFEFDISIEFKSDLFQKNFVEEVCNRSRINSFEINLNNYLFNDNTTLKNDIIKTIEGILKGSLVLKGNYTKQEAVKKLVQNWFLFHYQIKDGNDDISTMSPGKKSFIILKLLIELSNDRCPILLDQPEDDLDNRSIYNDLVKFIKDKKKNRQIIIVTHNPNLVVGADAECVIVANQSGAKSKNKERKFEYITGSLENGFFDKDEDMILYRQGIKEHVCDILEGGEAAFEKRKNKYNINKLC